MLKCLICRWRGHKWEHRKGRNEDGSLVWDYDVCKRCDALLINNAVAYSYDRMPLLFPPNSNPIPPYPCDITSAYTIS